MYREPRRRFSPRVEAALRAAGWYPGRSVDGDVAAWKQRRRDMGLSEMSPAAEEALREFGGLATPSFGAGIEMKSTSVRLVPSFDARYEERYLAVASEGAGVSLFLLGDAEDGEFSIAIGADGRVFVEMCGDVGLIGGTIDDALENLIAGRRAVRWLDAEA